MRASFYAFWTMLGLFFAVWGAILVYPSFKPYSYRLNPNYSGFGVLTNKTGIPPVHLVIIVSIEPSELYFKYFFFCEKNGTYDFLFIFPFNVTKKLLGPENMSFDQSSSYGSAIWLRHEINKTGSYDIAGKFKIEETFRSGSGGSYTFVLPFGFGVREEVIESVSNELNVTFIESCREIRLSFVVPSPKYEITQTFPERESGWSSMPDREEDLAGAQWVFEEKLQESVIIYCESPNEISQIQNFLFLGGLILGVGISIVVRTIYDYSKEKFHSNLKPSTKAQTKEEKVSPMKKERFVPDLLNLRFEYLFKIKYSEGLEYWNKVEMPTSAFDLNKL